jgi:ubiquinone/menaquinone biosynthesis C-methylase UbiE
MTDGLATGEISRSRDELDHPSLSALAFEAFTRQLLTEASLKPGMRVLDIFSGAGDVALLAGEIVGSDGRVVGFDSAPQSVAYANERAAFRKLGNVGFLEAQIEDLPFGADFDAIVGRIVLGYRRDPARDLQALAGCLRPGGLLVFQELDLLAGRTIPPAPVVEQAREWLIEVFQRIGIDVQMGPKLYSVFVEAGLEPPHMRLDGFIGGAESIAPLFLTHVVEKLLPQLKALGVATAEDMQIETLEERVRLDLMRTGGVMQSPLLIGAWTRLPA